MKTYKGVLISDDIDFDFDFTKFQLHPNFIDFECSIISQDPAVDILRINATANFKEMRYVTEYIAPSKAFVYQWTNPCKFIFHLGMSEDRSMSINGDWLYGSLTRTFWGRLQRC